VLFLAERFPPQKGGVAQAAGRQVRAVATHLARVDVLQLTSDLPPGEVVTTALDQDQAQVHRLGRAGRDEESLRLLHQVACELGRAHGHDVVHGFYAVHAGYVATLVARALERPSVVSLRGNDVDLGLFQGSRSAFLRFTLEQADLLLAVSTSLAEWVRVACGRRDGVIYAPNAVDSTVFTPATSSTPGPGAMEPHARPWIGFSGELRFKKGLPVLLRLAEDRAARGSGTVFALGGARTDERQALTSWRQRVPQASKHLVELPYEKDRTALAALYRALDLVVFPSLWDGMPNALLEAMACGRPVLGCRTGGIADVVEDGTGGFLTGLTRLGDFPNRVEELLARPAAEREQVAQAARARVVEHFSVDAERERLLEVYRRLAAGSGS